MKAIFFVAYIIAVLGASAADVVLTLPIPDDPTLCFPSDFAPVKITGDRITGMSLPRNRKIAFVEGLVPIRVGDKWGYLNTQYRIVIPARFDEALSFRQERALVKVGPLCGYIDRSGSYIAEPQFTSGFDFHQGAAAVHADGRWGLIGRDGKWLAAPRFRRLDLLAGGHFAVTSEGEQGFIDNRGEFIRSGRLGSSYQPAQ